MAELKHMKIGALTEEAQKQLLDNSFDRFWARKDRHAGVLGQFFEKIPAESLSFKISSEGSAMPLPPKSNDSDTIPYDTPAPGYTKTFNLVNYRLGIRATDTIITADRYGLIEGKMKGLIKSAMRKMEYQRATVLDGAFSGTAGSDSLALCHDSHPHENAEQGTWDNLGTGALTHSTLQALRLLGRKMTNEQGDSDEVFGRTLLVPPDLEQKGLELIQAKLMPENDLNQPNVLNQYRLVVSPYLNSATAHFVFGDLEGDEKGLLELVHKEINVKDTTPSDNPDIRMAKRVKFTNVIGFTRSKNVYGSAGT